ncbi:DUF7344 domain-containing protein [Halomicrobium katesii]|uniref:DUF7344 domain-containing protein n=1 Tax=Halomicrobium katesii TaxID=437163 RepID=UPI00036D5C5C|nr:hypothetical protein [Halomicrobium katesii]
MFSNNDELSQDTVFDVLSSARRRETIAILREEETPIELTTLAEIVAARENDTTVEELSSQDRKRVYVSLYQTHVPKLVDVGIVEHDADTGEVWLTSQAGAIEPYLHNPEQSRRWHRYYLVVAVVGGLAFLATSFGALPFVSGALLGQILVLAFVLLAGAQFLLAWQRRL